MKNNVYRIIFVLASVMLFGLQAKSQFVTTYAKSVTPGQTKGVFYSLPMTVIQLDFVIEESELFEGPYSAYAESYLGATDYVRSDGKEYKIVSLTMKNQACADPNATFFMEFGSRKSASVQLDLLPNGIIKSFGFVDEDDDDKTATADNQTVAVNNKVAEQNNSVVVSSNDDPFKNLILQGSDTPASIVAKIQKIRDEKFNLIKGYQETPYDSETLKEMYNRLEKMENDYLSLFLGKRVTRTTVSTLYVIPSKDIATMTVGKFSDTQGLTSGTSGFGTAITVQTISLQTTANINAPSLSAIESMPLSDKLIYRIPEMANIKVLLGNKVVDEERRMVSQLGLMMTAPIEKNGYVFDVETGQITGITLR